MTGLKATALVCAATMAPPVLGQLAVEVSVAGLAAWVCGIVVSLLAYFMKRDADRKDAALDELRKRHHDLANRLAVLELKLALAEQRIPTAASAAEKRNVR